MVVQCLTLSLTARMFWFEPSGQLGPSCVELTCSPRTCMGSLQVPCFLSQAKDMQVRLIDDAKLSVGVTARVNGCQSVCLPCD